MSTGKTTAWYAERYTSKFGMHLIPLKPDSKLPVQNDWGNHTISDTDQAREYFELHPDQGIGIALGPSRMASLDIDCMESFRVICYNFGIDLDALIESTPTLRGSDKGLRLLFRVPEGVELGYSKLNWHRKDDPSKSYTVFELRAASGDKQRFDVVASQSKHPDTGRPYIWVTQPREDWPTPPIWLLTLWSKFDSMKPQLASMCPWLPEPVSAPVQPRAHTSGPATSVIDAYCDANDLTSELARYGYKRVGKRWLSPHSGTGLPGVVLFPDGRTCWVHHSSDPLCSEDSGKPVNSFDLFCYYDHGNDTSKAVKQAADLLGMKPEPRARIQITEQQPAPDHGLAAVADDTRTETIPARNRVSRSSYDLESPLPFTTDKGAPVRHIENLAEVCRRIGVTIRYNMIAKEEEILIPGQSFSIDNMGNATLAWLRSECSLFRFPVDSIDGMVTYLADQNQYNPVAEWVSSKPWDGVSRVKDFYGTVEGALDHVDRKRLFKETLLRRWMISAIAAAFSPNGISAAGVLTFQGAQYLGKTKWFKQLVPAEIGVLKDGMILRPDDKDSVKQCVSFWLVELGELDATFRKADIAALKSFLTNDSDVLRRAYARKESKFARRTVFFASVNPKEFLHDPTGNRRYWTIEAKKLDHSHNLDMQQVWAEFYSMWKSGEGYYLTNDEVNELNEHNESFTAVDPIEDRILTRLQWDSEPIDWRWATATDLLMDIGFDRPTRADATSCAAFIRKHNGSQGRRSNGKTLLYAPRKVPQAF